ncbi:MAG: alpha-glucosidase [Eubacteriales bacterium]|nr:alpha-glucosidase [Eubacteriales bacterium]
MKNEQNADVREKRTWWKEAVAYQVYPRSFQDSNGDGVGDLNGITARLPYIRSLGADVIWLSPVYQSPNRDNGYDISDYRAIMKEFGTMEDFDRMLGTAHELGLRIVMDLVVNHTSDQHAWFVESRSSLTNPHRDYYIWREGVNGAEPNNWGACFGGPAWAYDPATAMYYLHMFAKEQPDLNWENERVRADVYDMMRWWCDKGIDGFRMDVISMLSKDQRFGNATMGAGLYADPAALVLNGPREHEFLQEMHREVLSRYDLMTVGETPGVTTEEAKKYAGFDAGELNMVFQFEHMDVGSGRLGKWTTKRFPLPELRAVLSRWQTELEGKAWNSLYWGNHDQPRAVSRFGCDREEYRALSAKMLATCEFMLKGTPFIYQGEELGMTNAGFTDLSDYRDLESINMFRELTENGLIEPEEMMECLRLRSRDNCRTPMQWDGGANAGFTTGTPWIKVNPNHAQINAATEANDPDSVLNYYKQVIRIRKQNEAAVYGWYELVDAEIDELWVFRRHGERQELLVACNFGAETQSLPMAPRDGELLIGNYPAVGDRHTLRPYEAVVYGIKK